MDEAHILIVEDDASLRLVLADNLEEEGYRVTATPSGDEAHRLLMGSDYPHAEGLADPSDYVYELKDFSGDEIRLVMRELRKIDQVAYVVRM